MSIVWNDKEEINVRNRWCFFVCWNLTFRVYNPKMCEKLCFSSSYTYSHLFMLLYQLSAIQTLFLRYTAQYASIRCSSSFHILVVSMPWMARMTLKAYLILCFSLCLCLCFGLHAAFGLIQYTWACIGIWSELRTHRSSNSQPHIVNSDFRLYPSLVFDY